VKVDSILRSTEILPALLHLFYSFASVELIESQSVVKLH